MITTNMLPGKPVQIQEKCVRIEAVVAEKLNLADFQNAVPLLRELIIFNETEIPLRNLTLSISSNPAFIRMKSWRLDAIDENRNYKIPNVDVSLEGILLSRLTEAEMAQVNFALTSADSNQIICQYDVTVELLPRNHWGGMAHLPDMIAAFVQPNDPAVEQLMKRTADILSQHGKSRAFDGYRSGPKRAWELTSALWSAFSEMGLDYALPPASFEHVGQKVRGPTQIKDSGLATCLDLALFFCSALEQFGLNPLVVFTQGHAFAGVWLKDDQFSSSVIDDITALRKRVKLKELVLFETTVVTHRPCPPFSHAVDLGAQQIAEAVEQSFELAIDIRRARLQRIKPLSSADAPNILAPAAATEGRPHIFEEAPDLPAGPTIEIEGESVKNPPDRLLLWQRKLLDLSMRNNLLNFKLGKKSIRLEAPNPGLLEDLLADGHSLKLLPRPPLMDGADPRNQVIHEGRAREDLQREHALDALRKFEVFVNVETVDLETRLVELYRTARTSMQEGGSNTLFLALGFLSWNRDDKDKKNLRAPLILIPITLTRKSVRSGFMLSLHEDAALFNPTLVEMLRQDYHLFLGIADSELPKDEHGLDVAKIWTSVSAAVKDIKGWEVIEDVVLSTFSFSKYLMWKDLSERIDQLKQNAVVRHLIDTPRDAYSGSADFPNPRNLDWEYTPEQTFCPLPADSSQLAAVMATSRGKDFVLIGPPGTGKSQTIANLIAQSLAEGKRVLFVSEKIAALDVVYRRLRDVGLGDFCLELHSNKARKLDVLDQLRKSWDAKGDVDAEVWKEEATRLKILRNQLNLYVERLHYRHRNGLDPYAATGRIVAGQEVPAVTLSWPSFDWHDSTQLLALRELADRLDINAQATCIESMAQHPLGQVLRHDWSPGWQQSLIDLCRGIAPKVGLFDETASDLCAAIGMPTPAELERHACDALSTLALTLPLAAGHDWRFALSPDARSLVVSMQEGAALVAKYYQITDHLAQSWPQQTIADIHRGVALLAQIRTLTEQLSMPWSKSIDDEVGSGIALLEKHIQVKSLLSIPYSEDVMSLDINHIQSEWVAASSAVWPASWLRKRKIVAMMTPFMAGHQKADFMADFAYLTELQALQKSITNLAGLSVATGHYWAGLQTRLVDVRAARAFQTVLGFARSHTQWNEDGLAPVGDGRCGNQMLNDLARARELQSLDQKIDALQNLNIASDSLWRGHETDLATIDAALVFQHARAQAKAGHAWSKSGLGAIADGRCGTALLNDLSNMNILLSLEQEIISYDALRTSTYRLWSGIKSNLPEIESAIAFHASLAPAIAILCKIPDPGLATQNALGRLLGEGNALLSPGAQFADAAQAYLSARKAVQHASATFIDLIGTDQENKTVIQNLSSAELAEKCQQIVGAQARLRAWCAWRKVRDEAVLAGLGSIVATIENGHIAHGSVRELFETNYCRWWLNALVDNDSVLRDFVSAEHEKRIKDFQILDDRFIGLSQALVRARLCAELPDQDSVSKNSEWGILRYEMQKKARHLPLRELMGRIGGSLGKLTPCLLMSPLSIAQYLAADTAPFDIVVFDEASQIPVWDAIGAIARGRQVVMVGDPKQLPPTNFFDRATTDLDEDDEGGESNLESILDECLGANLPTMNLSWHYRSRNESLIAFSNHRYYGGGLVTFPSPVTHDGAVSFHYIENGVYEKGGARINKNEAKLLVENITKRLKQPDFKESGLTIGVVTFNTEQQRLIEDLLDEERRQDPALESYFAESAIEPLFVKNIESVQGDERDIIYFSITYGPALDSTVSMNFGPMNKQGGERRLNVAITRARHELRIYSSLRPEQMDLARTQAAGVRDLKHFLQFAERGSIALAEADAGSVGEFESPFEKAVALALAAKGWWVKPQIGVSAFRIDLGIVDPEAPGSYLAGIECDGATYHRSATAKDRDKLREQVLRGLGWEIVRIWSTDWWIDWTGTLNKVHSRLEVLLAIRRARRAADAGLAVILASAVNADEVVIDSTNHSESEDPPMLSQKNENLEVSVNASAKPQTYARHSEHATVQDTPTNILRYVESLPQVDSASKLADVFFAAHYEIRLIELIKEVVEIEGPIKDEVLSRRIARAHGWQRTGARIHEYVASLASRHVHRTAEDAGIFFWTSIDKESALSFRRPGPGTMRVVDEISLYELISLANEITALGVNGEAAVIAMATEIGLTKLRLASRERLVAAYTASLNS